MRDSTETTPAGRPDRVLVTGATGFIGSHLVAALAAQNRRVRALVRDGEDASALERLGAEVVTGDVRAPASVKAAVRGCRTVFHLAAATGRHRLSRRGFLAINVGGTANVARASVFEGVERLVLASTTAVYGFVLGRRIDEDSPLRPGSRYARSKAAAERVALDVWRREGLHVSVARITNVLGRGAWEWLDLLKHIEEGRVGLVGPGTNRTHPAVVSDIVDGLILCESRGASGRTYLLAGADTVSLQTLLSELASALGVPPPVEEVSRWSLEVYRCFRRLFPLVADERFPRFDRVTFFLGDRFVDLSRARHELGYSPQARLEDGVQETVRWYREQDPGETVSVRRSGLSVRGSACVGVTRIVPYADGRNIAASRDFYVRVLGLEVGMEEPVLGLGSPANPTAQVVIPPPGMDDPQPRFGVDVGHRGGRRRPRRGGTPAWASRGLSAHRRSMGHSPLLRRGSWGTVVSILAHIDSAGSSA